MTREIDIPEYQYNNIMAFDSVNLGRVPYKGIIMYAINAIKRSKALEQTKNDLGVDCISRQVAIDAIRRIHPIDTDYDCTLLDKDDVMYVLNDLPSVTQQEPQTFKWCTDCKEYDQEKHCCHRWSKAIRNTVAEMKQEYIEREVLDKLRAEIECLETYYDTDYFSGNKDAMFKRSEVLDILDKYKAETEDT